MNENASNFDECSGFYRKKAKNLSRNQDLNSWSVRKQTFVVSPTTTEQVYSLNYWNDEQTSNITMGLKLISTVKLGNKAITQDNGNISTYL